MFGFTGKKAQVPTTLRSNPQAASSVVDPVQHQDLQRVQQRSSGPKKKSHFMVAKASANEQILFLDNLATMLNAGLPLSLALATLIPEAKSRVMRKALTELRHGIDSGGQFSDALEDHPEVFSPMFIAVVRVGEASGTLAEVLTRLAEISKKNKSLKSKAINALIYPAVVLIAMVAIVVVLMIYVFPQLMSVFEEVDMELPLQTRILIMVVELFQTHGLWIAAGVMLFIGCMIVGLKIRPIRYAYNAMLLKAPIIGPIVRELVLTRITGNLRLLLMSGVPIIQSLDITSQAAGNMVYVKVLQRVRQEIELGQAMYMVLSKRPKLFPSLMVTMVKVGEETGKIDDMLGKLEAFYQTRVENIFANLSTILEPVLLLSMGIMVGYIAIAVIMPIYGLSQAF